MMTDTFDICEIFNIAEQIERNGAKFYRRAAEIFDDDTICDILLKLADWETEHEQIFTGMKKRLSAMKKTSGYPKSEQIVIDSKAMAGLAVFGIKSDPRDELTGKESIADVLKRALKKEEESIVFYEGLKDFAADSAGRNKIDDIIEQEKRHVAILNELL